MTPYEIGDRLKLFKQKEVDYSKWTVQVGENVGDAIVTIDPPSRRPRTTQRTETASTISGVGHPFRRQIS